MSVYTELSTNVVYRLNNFIPSFTGSLLDISWQEWLKKAEIVLSQLLPLASKSTKYVAIKLRLDLLIQVRLRRLRVATYGEMNE
ncbi:hypothetical protein IWQ61_003753 [Dispira simplex]|nr:hypothetical protein IWQ61_003753 [Dispira simplex]